MKKKLINELIRVAKLIESIEFDNKDELKKYLKEHPDADKSKHVVKKNESVKVDKVNIKDKIKNNVKKLKEKKEKWAVEKKEFFAAGHHKPHSKARRTLGQALKDKSKGAVKMIKSEIKEWKSAATGMRKFINGKKMNEDESHAVKAVAKQVAINVALVVALGGIGQATSTIMGGVGQYCVKDMLVKGIGTSLIFAKDVTDDEALERLVFLLADSIEGADIPKEAWE